MRNTALLCVGGSVHVSQSLTLLSERRERRNPRVNRNIPEVLRTNNQTSSSVAALVGSET